ncbi:hypothetical protein ACFOGJ_12245 [Marinibaculum pumilum]|uniref:Uncharacterized protein n=1 Tax=Marinibaculum pumilum TaxID=1766165 RepID=A0ABV7L033_9PROT
MAFLRGPYGMVLASRDAGLFATCTMVFGCAVDADEDTVTAFVPDLIAGPLYDNLATSGRAALLVGHGTLHETYQFKGAYLGIRPTTQREQALQQAHRGRVIEHFRGDFGDRSDGYWGGYPLAPSSAVSFRVTDIFDQTPGPDAGRRLGL